MSLSFLQIRNPKDDETPIESATQIFSSLLRGSHPFLKQVFSKSEAFSFEIYLINQTIHFYIVTPQSQENFVSSLIASSYPKSIIGKTQDPVDLVLAGQYKDVAELALGTAYYMPLKTYQDFHNIDPLASVLGFLAKQDPSIQIGIQIIVGPAAFNWQNSLISAANRVTVDSVGKTTTEANKAQMLKKSIYGGGKASIRLITSSNQEMPSGTLSQLAGTYGSFSLGEGNFFKLKRPKFYHKSLLPKIKSRQLGFFDNKNQILNAQELATIWHPPGKLLGGIKNISWGKTLAGEPPSNLPVATVMNEDEKLETNFFAKTEFKNQEAIFGVKTPDRRKHIYIIGKTGTGKSTLIANMAIDDIRKGRGVGIIDPHGDLSETILDFIPKRRMNDVVYLEPFDPDRAFSLNVLEVANDQQKDLVASGIVAIFYKIYGNSWGPRLEYILRNVILTLLEIPDSTLVDVLRLLTDMRYRQRVVGEHVKDQVLRSFWEKEFDRMTDNLRAEAISPIQNKVGRFVSSTMIRNIIGQPKSTLDFESVINEGKILILNLSQGKLGEDNAALLGAMFITQLQLAAMNRSNIGEEERKDFFLYVDEFQNFATNSFIKILSEARKYRLSLILANQYIEQLDEAVQKAIFGNVGTLVSFVVGAKDATALSHEFGGIYTENDLVALGKFETIVKLSVDGLTSSPFPARTLPLPAVKNDNRDKIIQLSKERYTKKVELLLHNRPLPPEPGGQVSGIRQSGNQLPNKPAHPHPNNPKPIYHSNQQKPENPTN